MVEGHLRNMMCNYLNIHPLVKEKKSFKRFSIFSSGGHFVQQSGMICAILVEGHPRNIPVILFQNSFAV